MTLTHSASERRTGVRPAWSSEHIRWPAVAAVLAGLLASGCMATGDFGRPEPSALHQRAGMHKYASVPGFENASDPALPLSDSEAELRSRAYALTYSYAHQPSHGHWSQYASIVPRRPVAHLPDAEAYAGRIAKAGYQSSDARVNAIVDDIRADRVHIDAFYEAARQVYIVDAGRIADLERLTQAPEPEARVASRVEENRQIVEGTLFALDERLRGYEMAMGEMVLVAGRRVRARARREVDGLARRIARLKSEVIRLDETHALFEPVSTDCIDVSIASPCR